MLSTYMITVKAERGEREIFVSPGLVQSKQRPVIRNGMVTVLYFYGQMQDDNYKALLEKEVVAEEFKSSDYIINCGQDFEQYYLGSMHIDFDAQRCSQWAGKPNALTDQEIIVLAESIFDPHANRRRVMMFTPTRASDFNLTKIRFT